MNTSPLFLFKHKLLYDGLEEGYYNYLIEINIFDEVVLTNVIDYQNIFKLKKIAIQEFDEIISLVNGKKIEAFDSYKGVNDLGLVYTFKQAAKSKRNYLIVLSKGEYQSGRYMIFLEGIWEFPL